MKRIFSRQRFILQYLSGIDSNTFIETCKYYKIDQRCRRLCMSVDTPGEVRNVDPADCRQKAGDARSIDPASSKHIGVTYYLDTLAVCRRFMDRGFTRGEAEALTDVLSDVVGTVIDHQTKIMVTKPQQEIMVQQLLAQIASVKKDMVILEKSEFTMIRNDTEKQGIHIKQLEGQLADGIKKLDGQVKLDINLEKSRAVEAHALNEKQLQALVNRLEVEHAQNEKNLKALENKIDIDVSNLRTQHEKNRNDVQKYLLGLVVSSATLYMAYLRLVA